jgi:hypothetical protein
LNTLSPSSSFVPFSFTGVPRERLLVFAEAIVYEDAIKNPVTVGTDGG